MTRKIISILIAFCSLSFTSSCAYTPIIDTRLKTINEYIETADHLSETQKNALRDEKPFVGMTQHEAELTLGLQTSFVSLNDDVLYGVYSDSGKTEYHVYFTGSPAKVNFWSLFTKEDAKLTDLEDLHPRLGLP